MDPFCGVCVPRPFVYMENRLQMLDFLDPETECPLGIQVVNAGLSVTSDHAYRLNGNFRPESMVIWQYTLAGCGAIDRAGRTVFLPPGSAFFVRVPDRHVYYLPPDSPEWKFLYFSLNGPEAERLFAFFTKKHGHILRHRPDSQAVRICRALLDEAGENGLPDHDRALTASAPFQKPFRSQQGNGLVGGFGIHAETFRKVVFRRETRIEGIYFPVQFFAQDLEDRPHFIVSQQSHCLIPDFSE